MPQCAGGRRRLGGTRRLGGSLFPPGFQSFADKQSKLGIKTSLAPTSPQANRNSNVQKTPRPLSGVPNSPTWPCRVWPRRGEQVTTRHNPLTRDWSQAWERQTEGSRPPAHRRVTPPCPDLLRGRKKAGMGSPAAVDRGCGTQNSKHPPNYTSSTPLHPGMGLDGWRAGLHPNLVLQGSAPPPVSCPQASRGTAGGRGVCLEQGAALGQNALRGGISGIRRSTELRGLFLSSGRQAWGQTLPVP